MSIAQITRIQLKCDYCGDVRTLPNTWELNEAGERSAVEVFGWTTLVTNIKMYSFCDDDCRIDFCRHLPEGEVFLIDDETGAAIS